GPSAFDDGANAVTFEDRDGVALGTVLARDDEHAVRVPLARISPRFLAAIVATEDARFGRHGAVDPLALARAAWQLVLARHPVSGGSTIAMQLARLRVGVEAGARTYFGVPASDLDLAQAALLAALPNDPGGLDPYEHRGALERRRLAVLHRMAQLGVATPGEVRRAAAERVGVLSPRDGISAAPQLLFRLAARAPASATRVRTTLDAALQRAVENETAHVVGALGERGVRDAAAIVLDNRDGAILAYAGSANYFARRGAGKNDGVVALR